MEPLDKILEALGRIEANQQRSLEAQQQHLALFEAQAERSQQTVAESVALQKTAVARQALISRVVLPIILALVALVIYLLLRWRIL